MLLIQNLNKALVDCLIIVNSMALTLLVTSTHVAASKSMVLIINDAVSQVNLSTDMPYTYSMKIFVNVLLAFVSTLSIKSVSSVFSRNPGSKPAGINFCHPFACHQPQNLSKVLVGID
uniref:Uncharacterized protein n=1 Tax=Ditylenchus dipsaci TaxID=166011 RepID=A0A915EIY6_9BILA